VAATSRHGFGSVFHVGIVVVERAALAATQGAATAALAAALGIAVFVDVAAMLAASGAGIDVALLYEDLVDNPKDDVDVPLVLRTARRVEEVGNATEGGAGG
jgi:hypothetical protein